MFGRKKPAENHVGEPTPASERVRTEDSVLDELSRAFGTADKQHEGQDAARDDNAALISDDDDTEQTAVDPLSGLLDERVDERVDERGDEPVDAVADEPVELSIVTSDGDGAPETTRAVPASARETIRLGDDGDDWAMDAVPVAQALGRADREDGVRDVVITDRGPAPDRTTIAIGGDDVLPDAVYLDGDFDGDFDGDDSGTVFIDDDGTGDAIGVKDATTPGIEPRLRQRRIGVNRAANRKRIKWVGLIGVGAFILLGVLTVLGSSWFAINDVDVTGAVYTDENRLELVVDELLGTPALLADTEQAEQELESIPWVQNARVRVDFPNAATIEIRERTPVATMAGIDGRFRVLDNEGRVLDVIEGQPVAFVLIGGPSTLDLAAGEFAPVGQASAASLVTKLTPTLRPHVLSIDVTDDGADLVLFLEPSAWAEQTSPIRVRFGSAIGDGDQIDKLVRLEDQLDDLPAGTITEINVATTEVTVL
ncbi:MAG: FtsQ-type POTRA domain-containing protein [Ilumatobacter sp.]|uniref:cell division protein FtsQ/DivIB n=2 Tax=Ilumatobacter TaxID=682522 RepID=UPI00375296BD|nr:FtsQ-type POTRA domain-containing protein [Ilumatobacter sp.]